MTTIIKGLPIGTKVKILDPTAGCRGAQGLTGKITNGAPNYGIFSYEEGVNVVAENGDVWRVGNDTLVEITNPIKRVIFNPPATIVLWVDGTKTVAKCSKDDTFDKQTGLLICLAKHAYGHCLRLDSLLKDIAPRHQIIKISNCNLIYRSGGLKNNIEIAEELANSLLTKIATVRN